MEEPFDDENFEPPKKMKREWVKSYSNKAMEMMKKMGYENDKGLGKSNQGRLEPIIAVQQDGRRGFGLKLDTVLMSAGEWDASCEQIEIPEPVVWLENDGARADSYELPNLMNSIVYGPRKTILDDETQFCDPAVLQHILSAKTVFDDLNDNEKRRARSRSNPFETIRSSIFLNRAAVKMANMDSMCDFMFTNPKDQDGQSLVATDDLFYFADICAGPGGFSEYILFRKSWEAKGFGFTLRGPNDFKLDKFFAASPDSFDTYYGINDDGNIFDTSNQDSLNDYIRMHTTHGVHMVMADGGFSVEGQQNIQEVLSKQLYLCQFLTALKILRVNGIFIAIIKPNSSRPANSERYLVCKHKYANTEIIVAYMNELNDILNDINTSGNVERDILDIYDINQIIEDEAFFQYICESNNSIGRKQIVGLRKLAAFAKNSELKECRQSEVRQQCLKTWALPDKLRQAPEVKTTESLLEELLMDWFKDRSWLSVPFVELNDVATLEKEIVNIRDWYFVPIGRGDTTVNTCTLFLCKSRGNLLRYTEHKKWELVDPGFDVQPRSIFFGEIVYECHGEGRKQTSVSALHIIDGLYLGGIDIRRRPFRERMVMCERYARSLNKPYKKERTGGTIRSKRVVHLQDMWQFFNKMRHYVLKDNSQRLGYALDDTKYFVPGGLLIFCELTSNFVSAFSRSNGQIYYFDRKNNKSWFKNQIPPKQISEVFASFRYSYTRRLQWKWTSIQQVEELPPEETPNILYRSEFNQFINDRIKDHNHS